MWPGAAIGRRLTARKKVRGMANLHFLNPQRRAGPPDGNGGRSHPRDGGTLVIFARSGRTT